MTDRDEVLFERPLQVGTKRVYVDLRRNQQGVYLKLSEKGPKGNKNTVMIPAEGLRMIREIMDDALQSTEGEMDNAHSGSITPRFGQGSAMGRPKKRDNTRRDGTRSVYASGLAWETSWQNLKDHMRQAGEVEHCSVMTTNGRSLGCGVVEFATVEGAANAIAMLNDSMLDGRKIHVREDRGDMEGFDEMDDHDHMSNKRRRVRDEMDDDLEGRRINNPCAVFVSNLSWNVTNEDLETYFGRCGHVVNSEVMTGKNGRSIGCAVVEFAQPRAAERAINELSHTSLRGREIRVRADYQ